MLLHLGQVDAPVELVECDSQSLDPGLRLDIDPSGRSSSVPVSKLDWQRDDLFGISQHVDLDRFDVEDPPESPKQAEARMAMTTGHAACCRPEQRLRTLPATFDLPQLGRLRSGSGG